MLGADRLAALALADQSTVAFTLPPLPYAVDALEPHLDARTMGIHHGKHHAGYVRKFNAALDGEPALHGRPLESLLGNLAALPASVRTAVRHNGGGDYNHRLFWEWMSPRGGGRPAGDLAQAINTAFGSHDGFVREFTAAATGRFGSGWAWLVVGDDRRLAVTSTPNQDNPLMKGVAEVTGTPILGLDVWEHAYYLKYQNRRPDYLKAFWTVVNWNKANELYAAAKG
ncbi:superoxide dismutase, partial [bacterium]|nr:superoxide dismutase [bacterium]